MSYGNENTLMSKTELSAYKFMRRSFGWGTTLPIYWKAGGFFTHIIPSQGGILYQNIEPRKNFPAIWEHRASTEVISLGLVVSLI